MLILYNSSTAAPFIGTSSFLKLCSDGFKVGLSPYKKSCYFLDWKPFKIDEKCFFFHRESFFRFQDI